MAASEQEQDLTLSAHSRANEIFAIVWLAVGVLFALCLFTFSPDDQSFHTASRQTTQNFVGAVGSNVAAALLQFVGLTAYFLPVLCFVLAWRSFRGEIFTTSATRVIGFLLLIVSAASLLETFGVSPFFDRSVPSGGLLGTLVSRLLIAGLGGVGAGVVLAALGLVAFLLASNASFAPFVWVVVESLNFVRSRITTTVENWRAWRTHERAAARERLEKRRAAKNESDLQPNEPATETQNRQPAKTAASEPAPVGAFFARALETVTTAIANFSRRLQSPPDWATGESKHAEDFKQTPGANGNKAAAPLLESAEKSAHPLRSARIPISSERKLETAFDDETDFDSDDTGAELKKIPIEPLKTEEFDDRDDEFETAGRHETPATLRPKQSFTEYQLPTADFLNAPPPHIQHADEELLGIAHQLTDKCKEFKANGKVVNICPGPVVTTYEYKLDSGIKFNQITKLVDDLCLGLKAESVRIDRIPGKAFVGIEVPNPKRETIFLREVVESRSFRESNSLLSIALGKTVDGLNYTADLAKMPHLLIAGATGAGKSVGVNSLVVSVLYKARPDEVKFIMVDPKQVELSVYADIPHLATPIITEPKRAAIALKWAVAEMERRYKELAGWGVRNLDGYNAEVQRRNFIKEYDDAGEPHKTLPFIVIIIDEFADLMMVARSEVEESVTRLAQKARAVGIHLVLATQRPSVDVITGLIKANFPSRISFRVSSKIDSRTIIDGSGAEALLGRGDMLFLPPGTSRLIRVHGAFVDESEIAKIVAHVKEQGMPEYDTTITQSEDEAELIEGGADVDRDELFEQALRICVEMKRGSTSVLQRRLRIGYGRAAAILDSMEREGFVGQSDGKSLPRPVLGKAYEIVSEWDLQSETFS